MPSGDDYAFAEERRLFYVALTRARRSVTIITVDRMVSPFILELVKDLKLDVRSMDSKKSKVVKCPKCKTGTLKMIPGQYGDFIGCTAYPECRHKDKIPKVAKPKAATAAAP
jgi:DNA helicase-4